MTSESSGTTTVTTVVDRHPNHHPTLESCFTEPLDPGEFEAFEYQRLVDAVKDVEHKLHDLARISPLWFGVDRNDVGAGNPLGKGRRSGRMMLGNWQLDDSLVDVFEDQADINTQSHKQEALMVVDTLLTMCDENGARKRRDLEECALSFKNITEGDLPKRLDVVAELGNKRLGEVEEKIELATTGLVGINANMASRLEAFGLALKDRQQTVLEEMKREREAYIRKALATAQLEDGPHSITRLLFNKQLEELELEGKLRERQRLLDVSSTGMLKQEEIEGAMLNATRDHVQNLMRVMEKMQEEQTELSLKLHSDQRKVATLRLQISTRLGISTKKTGEAPEASTSIDKTATEKEGGGVSGGTSLTSVEQKTTDIGTIKFAKDSDINGRSEGQLMGERQDVGDLEGNLEGLELLEACDCLAQINLRLRQRLAKAKLHLMQRNLDGEDVDIDGDSRVIQVLEKKKKLEKELKSLERVLEKKSEELNRMQARRKAEYSRRNSAASLDAVKDDTAVGCRRENTNAAEIKTLQHNITRLRRLLVFNLALKIARRMFTEAGLGSGNDPTPPPGPFDDIEIEEFKSFQPRGVQFQAMMFQRTQVVQREIERADKKVEELAQAIPRASSSGKGSEKIGESEGVRRRLDSTLEITHADEISQHSESKAQKAEQRQTMDSEGGVVNPSRLSAPKPLHKTITDDTGVRWTVSSDLKRRRDEAQRELTALRKLAARFEEFGNVNHGMDDADIESLKEVLRREEALDERASALLGILESPEMQQLRGRWLKEMTQQSTNGTETASKGYLKGTSEDDESTNALASTDYHGDRNEEDEGGDANPIRVDSEIDNDTSLVISNANARVSLALEGSTGHVFEDVGATPGAAVNQLHKDGVMVEKEVNPRAPNIINADQEETVEWTNGFDTADEETADAQQSRPGYMVGMSTILRGGGGNEQHVRAAVETPRGRDSDSHIQEVEPPYDDQCREVAESHVQEIEPRYDDQPREVVGLERGDETYKQAREREACAELLKMRAAKLEIINSAEPKTTIRGDAGNAGGTTLSEPQKSRSRKLTKTEPKNEMYQRHSLKSQLMRWRTRAVVATNVLGEVRTKRTIKLVENDDGGAPVCATKLEERYLASDSRFIHTFPLLPVARVKDKLSATTSGCLQYLRPQDYEGGTFATSRSPCLATRGVSEPSTQNSNVDLETTIHTITGGNAPRKRARATNDTLPLLPVTRIKDELSPTTSGRLEHPHSQDYEWGTFATSRSPYSAAPGNSESSTENNSIDLAIAIPAITVGIALRNRARATNHIPKEARELGNMKEDKHQRRAAQTAEEDHEDMPNFVGGTMSATSSRSRVPALLRFHSPHYSEAPESAPLSKLVVFTEGSGNTGGLGGVTTPRVPAQPSCPLSNEASPRPSNLSPSDAHETPHDSGRSVAITGLSIIDPNNPRSNPLSVQQRPCNHRAASCSNDADLRETQLSAEASRYSHTASISPQSDALSLEVASSRHGAAPCSLFSFGGGSGLKEEKQHQQQQEQQEQRSLRSARVVSPLLEIDEGYDAASVLYPSPPPPLAAPVPSEPSNSLLMVVGDQMSILPSTRSPRPPQSPRVSPGGILTRILEGGTENGRRVSSPGKATFARDGSIKDPEHTVKGRAATMRGSPPDGVDAGWTRENYHGRNVATLTAYYPSADSGEKLGAEARSIPESISQADDANLQPLPLSFRLGLLLGTTTNTSSRKRRSIRPRRRALVFSSAASVSTSVSSGRRFHHDDALSTISLRSFVAFEEDCPPTIDVPKTTKSEKTTAVTTPVSIYPSKGRRPGTWRNTCAGAGAGNGAAFAADGSPNLELFAAFRPREGKVLRQPRRQPASLPPLFALDGWSLRGKGWNVFDKTNVKAHSDSLVWKPRRPRPGARRLGLGRDPQVGDFVKTRRPHPTRQVEIRQGATVVHLKSSERFTKNKARRLQARSRELFSAVPPSEDPFPSPRG